MGLSELTSKQAVLDAIEEYDRLGKDVFLGKYGFGAAKRYLLIANGKSYDSKAIAGVAYGRQFPKQGSLRSSDFCGGEDTVKPKLEELGFRVVDIEKSSLANLWSEWRSLDTKSGHCGSAVYELRIIALDQPISIPRFIGVDLRGVISIGHSKDMESRRKQFIRAIETCSGHSEGNLFYYVLKYSPLKDIHPNHRIEYRFRQQADKPSAQGEEGRMIRAYICRHGEPPPLNCAIPDRYGDWEKCVTA